MWTSNKNTLFFAIVIIEQVSKNHYIKTAAEDITILAFYCLYSQSKVPILATGPLPCK